METIPERLIGLLAGLAGLFRYRAQNAKSQEDGQGLHPQELIAQQGAHEYTGSDGAAPKRHGALHVTRSAQLEVALDAGSQGLTGQGDQLFLLTPSRSRS